MFFNHRFSSYYCYLFASEVAAAAKPLDCPQRTPIFSGGENSTTPPIIGLLQNYF